MSSPFGMPPGVSPGLPVQSSTPAPQGQPAAAERVKITAGPFVLSYPSLFVPKAKMGEKLQPGQAPTLKYSAELMCYADAPEAGALYAKLMDAANQVALPKFGKTLDSPIFRNKPVRNLAEREKYVGKPGFFISANSTQKPAVVIGNPPVAAVDPDELYAGCIVYANLTPAWYDNESKGVKWYLNSVWKVGEGPRLAVEKDPTSDYAHLIGVVPITVGHPVAPPAAEMPPWMQQQVAPQTLPQPHYQTATQPYGQVPPGYAAAPPQQQYAMPPGMPPMPGQWMPPQ
jgi:hypothetical protein